MKYLLGLFLLWVCAHALSAQEIAPRPLEVHVASVTADLYFLDQGSDAGIHSGDQVWLFPDGLPSIEARVQEVSRQSARIEITGPVAGIRVGTRGQVLRTLPAVLPVTSSESEAAPRPSHWAPVLPAIDPPASRPVPDHPAWTRAPEDWQEENPLLAEATPLQAFDRPLEISGSLRTMGSFAHSELVGNRNSYTARSGLGLVARNLGARAGELQFDADLFTRAADVGQGDQDESTRLRLGLFRYREGGRRGEPWGFEIGRFYQRAVPEFGRLDGLEVTRQLDDGRRVGISAGHMPQWNDALDSGEDWQVAFHVAGGNDRDRRFDWRSAFQKTWHGGQPDRDLFLLDAHFAASPNTVFAGSAWLDWYTHEDVGHASGFEWTRLQWSATHSFSPHRGIRFDYHSSRIPVLLRNDFAAQLEELDLRDHLQRTSLRAFWETDPLRRWNSRLEYWQDDLEQGYNAELGHEWRDGLPGSTDLEATLVTTQGSFSEWVGVRLDLRAFSGASHWQFSWQTNRVTEPTELVRDEVLWQHDVRASYSRQVLGGWDLTLYADVGLGDRQDDQRLSFFLGRRF